MKTQDNPKVDMLFADWKSQHQILDRFATDLSEWIDRQSKLRTAQFRETVQKLSDLSSQLGTHFAKEEEIGKQLRALHCGNSPEAEAAQRQSEKDHAHISSRLKHLIDRMQDAEADVDAWKKGVNELSLIIDVIEQHEEQESESVCCLIPTHSTKD